MLVFVDEAGDSGMAGKPGSSDFFIVSAVLFEDRDEANACDQRIDLLREELGLSGKEFHFCEGSKRTRTAFLTEIAKFQFFYFAIILNKKKLTGPGFQFKDSFYKYTVNLVFQNAKPHLKNAIVVVDRSGQKEFRSQLATYLKRRINQDDGDCYIKKIKMQNSHGNNLLQLADMVCGAVARSTRIKKEDRRFYRDLIRHRELSVQVWPR